MLEFKDCVGKRLLVKSSSSWLTSHPFEVKLIEISPSGEYVKLLMPDGYDRWHDVGDNVIMEVLPDVKKNRRSTDVKGAVVNVT